MENWSESQTKQNPVKWQNVLIDMSASRGQDCQSQRPKPHQQEDDYTAVMEEGHGLAVISQPIREAGRTNDFTDSHCRCQD